MPSITYGLRGLNYYQIELTGPARDLHSGVYGGAVPNPLTILTELFAKLHDKNFRVTVPGFYDDVAKVSKAERKALNALPWKKKDFRKSRRRAGLLLAKKVSPSSSNSGPADARAERHLGRLHGEGAKTVIPSKAYAKFSTRLVPNQDPHKIAKLVEKHIRKLLPKTVKCKFEVLSTGKPWVALLSGPHFQESANRAGKRLRQKSRVHSRRRLHPFRHADA